MSEGSYEKATAQRAKAYAEEWGLSIDDRAVGHGQDGYIFATTTPCGYVLKVFFNEAAYRRERNVYLRLRNKGIYEVCGLAVPELYEYDNDDLVIVMALVSPPFLLDFASAQLDVPQPPALLAEIDAVAREKFDDRWDEVATVLATLRGMGIWLSDVNPNNIRLERAR